MLAVEMASSVSVYQTNLMRRVCLIALVTIVLQSAGNCIAAPVSSEQGEHGTFEKWTVSDAAIRWQRPQDGPRHSDVSVSIRWGRLDANPFEKIALFHGTRFDWIYANQEFIGECVQRGYPVSHCTSPGRADVRGAAEVTYRIGRAEDIHGKPLTASWQSWGAPWGCYSNPNFYRLLEEDVFSAVDAGATYMHMDDPDTRQMLRWGGDAQDRETQGCFCQYCLERFRAYLGLLPASTLKSFGVSDPTAFNYKQFILDGNRNSGLRKHYEQSYEQTIRSFLSNLRASAAAKAKRHFAFACNNGSYTDWKPPLDLFDFAVGELSNYDPPTPVSLWKKAVNITRLNKAQVFTLRSTNVDENRKTLSLAYSLGMNFVAPWDVWLHGTERFFGRPQDYNDLFAFVRGNAAWLDGYEYAAAAGLGVSDDWSGSRPPVIVRGNERAFAFTRAVPGGSQKPVVVHLYDSGLVTKPFHVALDNARFFPGKRLSFRLLTPVQRSMEDHSQAEKTKDFSKFIQSTVLSGSRKGTTTILEISALNPWALLIVSPTGSEALSL